MTDSKYFTSKKKGEVEELRAELDSPKENVKKEAVKKVSFPPSNNYESISSLLSPYVLVKKELFFPRKRIDHALNGGDFLW